jgi:hypothetical protein
MSTRRPGCRKPRGSVRDAERPARVLRRSTAILARSTGRLVATSGGRYAIVGSGTLRAACLLPGAGFGDNRRSCLLVVSVGGRFPG